MASLAMALDLEFVVIGGGLMDPESTSEAFRERYLGTIRETALPYGSLDEKWEPLVG